LRHRRGNFGSLPDACRQRRDFRRTRVRRFAGGRAQAEAGRRFPRRGKGGVRADRARAEGPGHRRPFGADRARHGAGRQGGGARGHRAAFAAGGGTVMAGMRIHRRAVARAPASTANLGPGFDSLGMALSLYTWIDLQPADTTTVTLLGDKLQGVPADKTNLVYRAAQLVFREAGADIPELAIAIRSDIPSTRGLGSSAAAIVGALCA